ncbi:MAG: hypothetical protein IPP15_04455 [Saprospiraceae bacterium]|jgi:hypothetical protein|uniref:Uncharacterized protein n=1 Tax=Candidatus Opimibacter skivensis TaxID=2982028 RepID=A0A9D7STC8_9BACT|nr:hypothetical protein [Candidatus Opimibacter skivensis]
MMKSKQVTAVTFILFILCISSCRQSPKEGKEEEKPKTVTTSPYPSMSNEEITNLFSITDKVDMIFYNLPMSINQDDAKSAKNTVLYISPAPALMNAPCKALGRLSWISKGAIVKEADIYCDQGCQYFIFMTDNKPVASNAMSESGVVFFNQILSQAAQQRPK